MQRLLVGEAIKMQFWQSVLPVPGSRTALFFTVLPPHITGMHPNTQWHPGHIIMALPLQLYDWFCFSLCAKWQIVEGHCKKIGQPHYIHSSKSDDLIILHYFSWTAPSWCCGNFYTQKEREGLSVCQGFCAVVIRLSELWELFFLCNPQGHKI